MSMEEDELDTFKPGTLEKLAKQCDSSLAKSVAVSEYFKSLSLSIAQVIPGLLIKHISSMSSEEARVKELHSLMSDTVCIIDAESLLSFFKKYFEKIISVINSLRSKLSQQYSQQYKSLVQYIVKDLCKDLSQATHLDVNDLVITFKKRVLTECAELARIIKNELTLENEFINSLKAKLRRYEWVCKLTFVQNDIAKYLRISEERSLSDSEKHSLAQLIGIDCLPDDKVVLKLLEHYSIIKHKKMGPSNHAIIIVMAANLSLCDIIQWLYSSKYREVQFLCTECFYIDASVCYGKGRVKINNVAIVASKIIVVQDKSGKREIAVSGVHGHSYKHSHPAKDGSLPGAHGENGKNGEPGESGGNILICADEIENSEFLMLHSEGGQGGSGQHGGNGRDGKAIPSKSDDLRRFGGYEKLILLGAFKVKIFTRTFHTYDTWEMEGSNYAYGKESNGVQVLYGRNFWDTYAFLYSKGVNGVSADGGNAGRGGKAGRGGSAGHIDIFMKNGIDRNNCHNIYIVCQNGPDGDAGKPGKPGKRAIVESRKDYLVVDGWLKRALRYDGFIDARPYTGKDSSRLDRGWYYCEPRVAKCFDSNFKDGYVEFFKVTRNTFCPTKYNKQAVDGKEQEEEEEMIHSTPTKPINRAEIQMVYQVYLNEHFDVQDISSLIQLLEEMEQSLYERLQDLEKTYVKQQHKQIRRIQDSSNLNHVDYFDVDAQSLSRLIIKDFEGTEISLVFENITKIIAKLNGKPLFNTDECNNSRLQKCLMFIEDQLAKQMKRREEHCLPEEDKCELIYQLMEIVFHPTVLIHIDCKRSLEFQSVIAIFHLAEEVTAPIQSDYFHSRMVLVKQNITPKYKWSILHKAHQRLLDISSTTGSVYYPAIRNLMILSNLNVENVYLSRLSVVQ